MEEKMAGGNMPLAQFYAECYAVPEREIKKKFPVVASVDRTVAGLAKVFLRTEADEGAKAGILKLVKLYGLGASVVFVAPIAEILLYDEEVSSGAKDIRQAHAAIMEAKEPLRKSGCTVSFHVDSRMPTLFEVRD